MVVVPRYYDRQSLRPRNQQNRVGQGSRAGEFIGRGLQTLASGIGSFAEAARYKQALKDEVDARNAANQYREVVRNRMYDPQAGYLTQQGGNAINGQRKDTFDGLAEMRSEIANDLEPNARRAFARIADGLDNSAKDTAIRHEGSEFKDYTVNTFEASAQGYLEDALLNAGDETKFTAGLQAAADEIRNAAALTGVSPELLKLQLEELASSAHAGRVLEIARESPVAAYEYLQSQEGTIDREKYDKLMKGLEPAYYTQRARDLIDERGGVGGGNSASASTPTGDWLVYQNEGKIRSKPLNRKLVGALSVIQELGLGFEVVSGGQDAKGTPFGVRTGSTRHDDGNAADGYFTRNGERLSWAKTGDRAIIVDAIRRLRQAGITGIGAGPGYMGEGSFHIGFGSEAVWGAGGRRANAPDWLVEAFNGKGAAGPATAPDVPARDAARALPQSNRGMTLTEAMAIDDPKLRDATIREIELRRKAVASDRQNRQSNAREQAWSILDNGGSPDQIPPELQAEIGLSEMNTIFDTYARNQRGVDYTDETRHLELLDMSTEDPDAFASLDLNEERGLLSRSDLLAMRELQSSIKTGRDIMKTQGASALIYEDTDYRQAMTDAADQYQAAVGVAPGGQMTQEQLAQYNRFTRQLRTGMQSFADENNRKMSFEERTNFINTLLAPAIIDGIDRSMNPFSSGKAYLFEIPSLARDGGFELQYGRMDVPAAAESQIREKLTDAYGRAPSEDEIIEQYENELLLSVGISPVIEYKEIPQDVRKEIFRQYPNASRDEVVEIFLGITLQAAMQQAPQ